MTRLAELSLYQKQGGVPICPIKAFAGYLHLRGKRYTLGGAGLRAASDRKPEEKEIKKTRSAPQGEGLLLARRLFLVWLETAAAAPRMQLAIPTGSEARNGCRRLDMSSLPCRPFRRACRKRVPITHLIAQTGQPSNNGYATRIRSLKLNWINSAVVLIPRSSITRYLWNAMVLGVTLRISAASFIDFPSANTWITCR